jgi:short-subunit dehydrogenase
MNGFAGRVVLTGASSGIGAALAAELAGPGASLVLLARDPRRLAEVAARCRDRGAVVETDTVPVTAAGAMAGCLGAADARRPIDLVIANAGIASGRHGEATEPEDAARAVLETNVLGMFNTVAPLLPAMVARGRGRIALVSSIAAIRPHADLPAYSASKAAVRAWGTALRSGLRGTGVGITVICPGFVTSPMSGRHRGPKPFEIDAAAAARLIAQGLRRGAPFVTFPWQLALVARLGNLLPVGLGDWAERRFAARIEPDTQREPGPEDSDQGP